MVTIPSLGNPFVWWVPLVIRNSKILRRIIAEWYPIIILRYLGVLVIPTPLSLISVIISGGYVPSLVPVSGSGFLYATIPWCMPIIILPLLLVTAPRLIIIHVDCLLSRIVSSWTPSVLIAHIVYLWPISSVWVITVPWTIIVVLTVPLVITTVVVVSKIPVDISILVIIPWCVISALVHLVILWLFVGGLFSLCWFVGNGPSLILLFRELMKRFFRYCHSCSWLSNRLAMS